MTPSSFLRSVTQISRSGLYVTPFHTFSVNKVTYFSNIIMLLIRLSSVTDHATSCTFSYVNVQSFRVNTHISKNKFSPILRNDYNLEHLDPDTRSNCNTHLRGQIKQHQIRINFNTQPIQGRSMPSKSFRLEKGTNNKIANLNISQNQLILDNRRTALNIRTSQFHLG